VCEEGSALERKGVRSNAFMQECVCEMGYCARTNASVFERRPMSAIERTGYFERIV
jgi:hypothetical protein